MKFILNKDKLTVENEESANSGSVQYYEVDVEHDESWNDLIIEAVIVPKEGGTLIFDDAESIAEIDNKIYIDRELSGSYAIGFKGFTIENEVKVYQISTNLQGVYFEVGAGQIITTNSIPKPTEWEIYVAQIEAIANRASQSASSAQTSADNAENSAENAQASAETATEQAESATASANTATEQAGIATEQAGIATTKAGKASQSATKAKTSEDNAKASEQSAESSASSASASATSAGNSASSAATSASLASSSAATATQKANEASASASSASQSATAAAKSKNDAQDLVNGFTSTVQTATNTFNTNATNKTNTFNTNATNKTNAFNENTTQKTNDFNDNATQKTNDFNTNASDKTTEFNAVVDIAKDDIEEIAPMLQDKITKIPSMMQDKTATGTSIHTEDSANWYGKLNFEGFSRQETTTGANILKFTERTASSAGMSYSCDDKGQVILMGTATMQTGYEYNQSADAITLNAGTYKFKAIGKYDTLRFSRTDKNSIITLDSNGEGTVVVENDNTAFRVLAYSTVGDTYDCNFYLTLTAEATATTERYTGGIPQPNIDYPSEIRNLESNGNMFTGWIKGKGLSSSTGAETTNVNGAVSDYIPVDFTQNPNYYLQGLTSTLSSFIAAYNSNKEFLGRSGVAKITRSSLKSSSFSGGTPQGTGNIAYIRVYQYKSVDNTADTIDEVDNLETQLLSGTAKKPYAPYDSLKFKQVNENLFDDEIELGTISSSTGANTTGENRIRSKNYIKIPSEYNKLRIIVTKPSGTFSIRTYDSGKNYLSYSTYTDTSPVDITFAADVKYFRFVEFTDDLTCKFMITTDLTQTEYIPHQEHNIDFPLEGQKMYAGSKPTDSGIKHIKAQVILDGTETVTKGTGAGAQYNYYRVDKTLSKVPKFGGSLLCSHFKAMSNETSSFIDNGIAISSNLNRFIITCDEITTAEDFQARLAQEYANGTPVTIEYELAEPETVPYTQAQQDAYNELQNLETYQYVNNIELIANEDTNMTFEYKKDIQMQIAEENTRLDNIESRLALLE